ncbi:MAG: translation initiation factor IF-6 [Nanobdellota archaeon]
MHLLRTNISGNPNVGLYGYATDDFCLLGREVPEELSEEISKILDVPVYRLNLAGTSLLGVFLTGNSSSLLVPSIAFPNEIKKLEEIGSKHSFSVKVIDTELTALGNNMFCNDSGCMISPDFDEKAGKQISEALGMEVKRGKVASLPTIGSLVSFNSKGCAVHRDAEQFEVDFVKEVLGIESETSTVNMGNPFVRSGILVNDKGLIVGDASGGPEVNHLDHVFGFVEDGL